jgi:hypothetical protein
MAKYQITFFVADYPRYFHTNDYDRQGNSISFISIPTGNRIILVGSFMIEDMTI